MTYRTAEQQIAEAAALMGGGDFSPDMISPTEVSPPASALQAGLVEIGNKLNIMATHFSDMATMLKGGYTQNIDNASGQFKGPEEPHA